MSLQTFLEVRRDIERFLQEDIGKGDVTSSSITMPLDVRAEIICKTGEPSVAAGLEEAAIAFEMCGCREIIPLVRDGDVVKKGNAVMRIRGSAVSVLKAERTALNIIMRMSGIATTTKELVRDADGKVSILATRKTAPGLRYFDKKSVILGGGRPHRMRLDDAILIKDNHIKLRGDAVSCIQDARDKVDNGVIECEVTSNAEAVAAVQAGADVIMLDNFSSGNAARTILSLRRKGIRRKVEIELSGGITPANIRAYAKTGADSISLGFLTHSARAADYSMEIVSA